MRAGMSAIFQPGEETGTGGARVCEELLQELRLDRILGYHNIPGVPLGTVLLRPGTFACASLGLAITLEGQQSHAAYPEQGKNPAYLISELILRLPKLMEGITQNQADRLLMATVVQVKVGERNFGISAGTGMLALTPAGTTAGGFAAPGARHFGAGAAGLCSGGHEVPLDPARCVSRYGQSGGDSCPGDRLFTVGGNTDATAAGTYALV